MRILMAGIVVGAVVSGGGLGSAWAQGVPKAAAAVPGKWAIVLHGGAGGGNWARMPEAQERAYHEGLDRALKAGAAVLARDGSGLDAVEAAIHVMEDDPLFNAGKGAVFTADGVNEMDAAIMNGATLEAGAVAGVHETRHPISAARAVMERTKSAALPAGAVLLAGPGADQFSKQMGLEQEPRSYFWTERRWKGLLEQLKKEGRPAPPLPAGVQWQPSAEEKAAMGRDGLIDDTERHRYGTVGVVVRDRKGNLAAGTSTGGLQAKLPGRVGDTPILGAGTYANNASCAVSGTGTGEYFLRLQLARSICDLVAYKGMGVQAAADEVMHAVLPQLPGGDGGVIVMGPTGDGVWSFNTAGMFRARLAEGGTEEIAIRH